MEISNTLNKIHNENHDTRYWRLLLDPFLFYYISVMYDRWEIINSVVKKYKKIDLGKIDDLTLLKPPHNFEEFVDFWAPIPIECSGGHEDAYSKWRWEKDLSQMEEAQEEGESLSLPLLTPLAVASVMGHDAIIELLKARGATQ